MTESDLPESWRRALQERAASDRPAPVPAAPARAPIQPSFRFWPWGLQAILIPLAAQGAAFFADRLTGNDFPSLTSGAIFFAILCGFNGRILSLAMAIDRSHGRFAGYCALAGAASVGVLLIPGLAYVYLGFLIVFLISRVVAQAGAMSAFIIAWAFGFLALFLGVLNYAFNIAAMLALENRDVALTLTCVAAAPLSHSLCTAALPAEKTSIGRLDAMLTGVSAALAGMFVALVVYRTVLAGTEFVAERMHLPAGRAMAFAAASCALAAGNWVCVKKLFRDAYSAREERALLRRGIEARDKDAEPIDLPASATPGIAPTQQGLGARAKILPDPQYAHVAENDPDVDEAT